MTISIGQVTYSLYPAAAAPGMIADIAHNMILSFVAAETINPGRLLELASDGTSCIQVQRTQGSSDAALSTTGLLGFSVLETARAGVGDSNLTTATGGAPFLAGDMVPVLRRGVMFAEWKGTTQTAYAPPNVYHSSTVATDRGKLTDATVSHGSGTEVSPVPSCIQLRVALTGSGSVALIDVNLPT